MNITFKRIRLCNFMSFGDSEIDLNVPGYTLVKGVNNNIDDSAISNGSGKSSIWEAISWVLTGETIRGCKNVTNINGNDGALVELVFVADGDEYIITRTKDHSKLKSNLKIIINGEDKSGKGIRDTAKLLEQYLPDITPTLLGSVIILGQGLPQRFTNNSPSGRKEVLEKLSKSDFMIDNLKNRINSRISVLNDKKRKLEDSNLQLNTQIDMLNSNIVEFTTKLNNLGDKSELQSQLDEYSAMLNDANEKYTEASEKYRNAETDSSKLREDILQLKLAQTNAVNEVNSKYASELDNLCQLVMSLKSDIRLVEQTIKQKKSVSDICPTCGQKLIGVEKPDTSQDEITLRNLNDRLAKLIADRTDVEHTKSREIDDTISKYVSDIESKNNDLSKISLSTLKSELDEAEKCNTSISNRCAELSSKLIQYEDTELRLRTSISDTTQKIGKIQNELLYNQNDMDEVVSHIDVLNKMNTYIKRDFRGYLLTSVIDYLDTKAKMYCNDIFEHSNINFVIDGNNIAININNKEYEQLSGGEKQKVDLIIQLAIRDMLCMYSNFSSNIFVLDEIFDNLDETGSEKILNMLTQRLDDVSSIYIVTHHSSIPIPVDRELLVIKDTAGISRVS